MKTRPQCLVVALTLLALATLNSPLSTVFAQGTGFTYQGRLNDGTSPAAGIYDLRYTIFDSTNLPGTVIAGPVTNSTTSVSNGLFTVTLDFGAGVFTGPARWLEIGVRTNGASPFVTLSPRQNITPAPYAITAVNLASVVAYNTVNVSNFATVGGGNGNIATGLEATIAGGYQNNSGGSRSTIGGGYQNTATNSYATIGGGVQNTAGGNVATVAGGQQNNASGSGATVGGGYLNTATNNFATVPGGYQNTAGGPHATVGGGNGNTAAGLEAIVGGGFGNNSSGGGATVGGGFANTSSGDLSTVGGGESNTSSDDSATVGGGDNNTSSGISATVGGGYLNTSSGTGTTVGGGDQNTSSGDFATVPGGLLNSAAGTYSFAAGHQAKANHQGSFVWADSQNIDFTSTTNDQFNIRAANGVQLATNTSLYFGTQTRQMLNLWGTQYGIGVQSSTVYFRTDNASGSQNGFAWYKGGTHNDAAQNAGAGGATMMKLDGTGLTVNGTFVSASDRNVKQDFADVNSRTVLEKVAQLPIQTWAYTNDPGIKHLGPVAQDFYAAFNVGPDDKHITTVDESGVALAAIQGLNQKLDEKDAEIQRLEQRLEKLEQRLNGKTEGAN